MDAISNAEKKTTTDIQRLEKVIYHCNSCGWKGTMEESNMGGCPQPSCYFRRNTLERIEKN